MTGTQQHHQRPYGVLKEDQEGLIGEITGNVYWNQGMLWYKQRQEGWSDMNVIRDWVTGSGSPGITSRNSTFTTSMSSTG